MSVFKVEGSVGSKSQTVTFEEVRYSGQCLSVPTMGSVTPPPVGNFLMLESGDHILLETGDKVILE